MTIPKGTRLGPYALQSQVGAGGTGAIYLAVVSLSNDVPLVYSFRLRHRKAR